MESRKRAILPALTSLRFFAALGIVFLHARGYFGLGRPSGFIFWGTQPVSFFFVLSGFILYYCHPKIEGGSGWRRFYVSRWSRIWPLHVLTFVAAILCSLIPGSDFLPREWGAVAAGEALANVALIHSWIPLPDFYASYNEVSWSISVEFFFYLLFPVFLIGWDRRWKFWLGGSAALVLAMMILCRIFAVPGFVEDVNLVTGSGLFHHGPLARVFEFLLGMTVGLFFRRRQEGAAPGRKDWTGIEIGVLGLLAANLFLCLRLPPVEATLGSGAAAWIVHCGSCFSAAAVIFVFAHQRGRLSAALSWRPLYVLGECSFALYLLHNLYFATFRTKHHPLLALPLPLQFPVYLIVALGLSYLCWRWYEIPARDLLRRRISGRFSAKN